MLQRPAPSIRFSSTTPTNACQGGSVWPLTLNRMKWRVEGCAMMAISRQGAATSSGLVTSMSACQERKEHKRT